MIMLLRSTRVPVVTIALSAVALVVHARMDGAGLQLDRTLVAAGDWWRLITCHFTHWSADHFAWDFMMYALLGGACEVTSRRRTLITLGVSTVAIPLAVLLWQPQLQTYRGLSGLDSALFGLLAVELLWEKLAQSDRRSIAAIGLLVVGFIAKTGFETVTGSAVFADSARGGFVPVPLAHLVGFLIGAITFVAATFTRNRFRMQSSPSPLRWPAI
jgi:rhomboid family GlyGly-CTERM serine protease